MTAPVPAPVLVLGVGSPWRGDDGVGAAVVRAVATRLAEGDLPPVVEPPGNGLVEVAVVDGEPARVIELWQGRRLTVVVDATVSGAEPGTVHHIEVDLGEDRGDLGRDGAGAVGGSHAMGLADAVRLGRALGRLPGRLVTLGVEAAELGHTGDLALSPLVSAAVPDVVDGVLAEVGGALEALAGSHDGGGPPCA